MKPIPYKDKMKSGDLNNYEHPCKSFDPVLRLTCERLDGHLGWHEAQLPEQIGKVHWHSTEGE